MWIGGRSKPTNLLMNILLSAKNVVNENALPKKYNALNHLKDASLRRAFFSNNFNPDDASKATIGTSLIFAKSSSKLQSSYIPKDNSLSEAVTSDSDTRYPPSFFRPSLMMSSQKFGFKALDSTAFILSFS